VVIQVQRHAFTVAEYHRMAEAGIFTEDDRVELLEGEIVEMAAIGRRHAACVKRLVRAVARSIGERAVLSVQDPVHLDDRSEPQPDLALLAPRSDFYESGHPGPEDVLLVIEVADTTADYDRQVKLPLYAHARIREVWLVDLAAEWIEVYPQPSGDAYLSKQTFRRGQRLAPEALPDLALTAAEVLG